ncbi:MAG: MmgE/PrpD family protein [Lachnospiraceae bacterium]|nr:MmgE/PrpD family protein [Lachnospiraceae bacterium]
MGISAELAAQLAAMDTLSTEDIEALRLLMLDFFAAAYAGYRLNRAFNRVAEQVVLSAGGKEEAWVLGASRRYPAGKAAFMNAAYGHGAELDDGNKKAMGHAGVHLIPAVFALAEKIQASEKQVLLALATGYEAYIRLSSAAQPGMVERGFHSTGFCGTLACAAACAKLLGLGAEGLENAIALATTMTGGLLSYGDSRPYIKPLNPGKAAENGLMAAELAAAGMLGPAEALEGPNGWFHAAAEQIDESMLQGGGRLLLHDCYIKLYPSCRHTHCGIDAAVDLISGVDPALIDEAEVYIYPNAIKLAGQILYPADADETKFSIHYTLAKTLLDGHYGIEAMDPPDLSPRVREMIGRIRLIPDASLEDRRQGIRGARLVLHLKDGTCLEKTVLVPRGDPERPLSRADVLEKLRVCAGETHLAELPALIRCIEDFGEEKPFVFPLALPVSGVENAL